MAPIARRRAPARPLLLGALAVPIVLTGSMLSATAANAADATVTTKADLRSALAAATNADTITLGADLIGDGGPDDALVLDSYEAFVNLDLNGHELDVDSLWITGSAELDVFSSGSAGRLVVGGPESVTAGDTGPTGVRLSAGSVLLVDEGATLRAQGSAGRAGIGTVAGDDRDAQLIADGGTIRSIGGVHGAGIGGGEGALPATTYIHGGTVSATGGAGGAGIGGGYANAAGSDQVQVQVDYRAVVVASGGAGAAGIGGGTADPTSGGGGGVAFRSDTGSGLTATDGGLTSDAAAGTLPPSMIGTGQGSSAPFGALNIYSDGFQVPAAALLRVPAGATAIIVGSLIVAGRLSGEGTVRLSQNALQGVGVRATGSGRIDAAHLTFAGVDHRITFDAGAGTTTAPATLDVPGQRFPDAGFDLASYTGSLGDRRLVGWYAAGRPVFNSTLLAGPAGSQTGALTLRAAYEHTLAISTGSLPNAATGQRYAVAFPATDDARTYSVAADPSTSLPAGTIPMLPPGINMVPVTGEIAGWPTTPGRYSFVMTAASDFQTVSRTVTMEVGGAPAIATASLPEATVGSAYRVPVLASSTGGAVSWSVTGGVLPRGVRLDSATGALVGTPAGAGTYTFEVAATNAYGSARTTLTLGVGAADEVSAPGTGTASPQPSRSDQTPQPSSAPPAKPVLPALSSLTSKLGHPLSASFAASSTGAVAYSTPAGDLPAGLALDPDSGLLYGAPQHAGTYRVHVTASNAVGSTSRVYTVVVPAAVRAVSGSVSTHTQKAGATVDVAVRGVRAGDRWRISIDGRLSKTGIARADGTVERAVRLPVAAKDRTHTITVSSQRRVGDPSLLLSDEITVTSLAVQKRLAVSRTGSTITIRGLAPHERVKLDRGVRRISTGRADDRGMYRVKRTTLKAGTYRATGASAQRTGALTVR